MHWRHELNGYETRCPERDLTTVGAAPTRSGLPKRSKVSDVESQRWEGETLRYLYHIQ
jgi:hypothetical protein